MESNSMNMNPQESAISLTVCGKLITLGLAAIGVDLLIIKAVNTPLFSVGNHRWIFYGGRSCFGGKGNRDVDPPFRHYTSALSGEIFWDHPGLLGRLLLTNRVAKDCSTTPLSMLPSSSFMWVPQKHPHTESKSYLTY